MHNASSYSPIPINNNHLVCRVILHLRQRMLAYACSSGRPSDSAYCMLQNSLQVLMKVNFSGAKILKIAFKVILAYAKDYVEYAKIVPFFNLRIGVKIKKMLIFGQIWHILVLNLSIFGCSRCFITPK